MSDVLYTAQFTGTARTDGVRVVTPDAAAPQSVAKLRERFPQAIQQVEEFRGDYTVTLANTNDLISVATYLRDDPDLAFRQLDDITAVDRSQYPGFPAGAPRFCAIYHLFCLTRGERLALRLPCPGGDSPVVPSLTPVWPGANFPEREAYDLVGVKFEGHPDLRRIFMPLDWPNHPLRKDVPRGGETVPYSMTWEDEEFQSFGKQILPAKSMPWLPPKQADANEHMIINMGPQHPATHGVLRVIAELDGERVVHVYPDLGYLHSGFEKQAESIRYKDFAYYTDRMDYLSAMSNNLGYALAVEKLMGVEVPPRARVIRVICAELSRLASHLFWLGTHAMDVSGTIHALLMYALREREQILDIFEMVCGARLTLSYIRPGGLFQDVPPAFQRRVQDVVDYFPRRFKEYEKMLTDNPIWRARLQGIGKLTAEQCLALGVTGPLVRAAGIPFDLRRARPYCGYDKYDFEIPTETAGDSMARYFVRLNEMRESVRIIDQALKDIPEGPFMTDDRKMAIPPRQELDVSMEAVIHHFKLMTQGYTPPLGEVYEAVEGPRGQLGYYIVSDGSGNPYRLHIHGPSFWNLQATEPMAAGSLISDLVAIIGQVDIVLGDVDR
jgi:NADH-quinone oxidoreductase subunit C/D